MKKSLLLVLTVLFFGPLYRTHAQSDMDYAVSANIVYQFTKYIEWPEEKKAGDFIIGVLGESPMYEELKRVAGHKSVCGQKIQVEKLSDLDNPSNCHIVYIDNQGDVKLRKIVSETTGLPVLLVCEEAGMALRGACIDFATSGERLTLEINKRTIERRHLHVATELLQLGSIIR